jgi:adenylosuccinate synthase
VTPLFTKLPGWKTSTKGVRSFEALPERARQYLDFLERETGVEVGAISTGPEREETIVRPGSRLANLIG